MAAIDQLVEGVFDLLTADLGRHLDPNVLLLFALLLPSCCRFCGGLLFGLPEESSVCLLLLLPRVNRQPRLQAQHKHSLEPPELSDFLHARVIELLDDLGRAETLVRLVTLPLALVTLARLALSALVNAAQKVKSLVRKEHQVVLERLTLVECHFALNQKLHFFLGFIE